MNWDEYINSKGKRTWDSYTSDGNLLRIVQEDESGEQYNVKVFHHISSKGLLGQDAAASFAEAESVCTKIVEFNKLAKTV